MRYISRECKWFLYTFCQCRTSGLSSCQNQDMGALPHYNLTGWFAQLAAVSMCWRIFGGNRQGKWSSDHFHLPLLLPLCQQEGSDFPHASLKGTDLQGLIASGGAVLQLPEDIAATSLRIGLEPGHDLLPLSFKGIFVSAPPAQHSFSPLLLAVQGLEACFRSGSTHLGRKLSRCTPFYRKDLKKAGKGR